MSGTIKMMIAAHSPGELISPLRGTVHGGRLLASWVSPATEEKQLIQEHRPPDTPVQQLPGHGPAGNGCAGATTSSSGLPLGYTF